MASNPPRHPSSDQWIRRLDQVGLPLTSDPTQYAIAIYRVDAGTRTTSVRMSGYFSDYRSGTRHGLGFAPTVTEVPIPAGAVPGRGSDGQVILWDRARGIEWGFWQFQANPDGSYSATNGYVAPAGAGAQGVFADGLAGRGAGFPYLSGTIRSDEMAAGSIDHALSFAYRYPSKDFVAPASKSDGRGTQGVDLPEGARLQLDPSLSEAQLRDMGLSPEALVVARALQRYGMIVVDNSGSSKFYFEDTVTARWDPAKINAQLLSRLPWSSFRVVSPDAPLTPGAPPASQPPTAPAPTAPAPTAPAPTSQPPTAPASTTPAPTSQPPTAPAPTTQTPTTPAPTTPSPATQTPTTQTPTTPATTTPTPAADTGGLADTGAFAGAGVLGLAGLGAIASGAGLIVRRRRRD